MQVRCKRWLPSESKNPAKLRERRKPAAKPPFALLWFAHRPAAQARRLSFTPTADLPWLHRRSSSHMSVAQGTEVLYMRLCGYRRYRHVVGLQQLFTHSQLDICSRRPVESVGQPRPKTVRKDLSDRVDVTARRVFRRFPLRKAITVYRSRLPCSGVANATPK